jgi:hypothetical protein
MADIKTYTSSVVAQGAQADASAFGAPQARALGSLAQGAMDVATALRKEEIQQDTNDVQVKMMEARAYWAQQLRDRANQAQPGDETFADRLKDDMTQYFDNLSQTAKTPHGQQIFRTMSAAATTEFYGEGLAAQAQLAGQNAKLNMEKMAQSGGQLLMVQPEKRESVLADLQQYVNTIPGISNALRQQLYFDNANKLNASAVMAQIQRNPDLLLAQINPKEVDANDPTRQLRTGNAAFDALPAQDQYHMIKQAREYSSAYRVDDERKRIEAERQRKQGAEQSVNTYVSRILDPQANGGALSAREVAGDPTLDGEQKKMIMLFNRQWQEEQLRASERPSPYAVRQLMQQIHAAEDDPKKTYSDEPIFKAYTEGRININEFKMLRQEVTDLKEGGATQGFTRDLKQGQDKAYQMLTRSIQGQAMPEKAVDAAYRFNLALRQAVEQYRKNGKDPRSLITEGSRDYMLSPERVLSYMKSGPQTLADGAAAEKNKVSIVITDADYDKLPSGTQFQDPRGNIRVKP